MTRKRAKAKLLPAHLVWRDGRPRWVPSPSLRKRGFKGRDLRDADGRFLGLEAAITEARKMNLAIAEAQRTGAMPKPQPKVRKIARTCRHLYEVWSSPDNEAQASPRWQKLAASTKADYRNKAEIFLAEYGSEPVVAIRKSDMHTWWEHLYRTRGHAMANGTIAVVRAMFSYAEMKGWRETNPCKSLGLERLAPRGVTHDPAEITAQLAAAAEMGLHGIGDAIVIALHTGQREGDVLRLVVDGIATGRAIFRQSKRGARVSVPFTPALAERLEEIAARRRQGATPELRPVGELVRDRHGQPYETRWSFGRDYRAVRARAVEMLTAPSTPAPELAEKHFADLRDTAITRLADAECTVAEISSITGHEMQTIHQVLKHYIAVTPRMADAAIARLIAYMQREGIAV